MKAGQTLLFSFASPASLPSWKNGTFGGRCLSCRVYAAQPIRWGSRTRSVIGHFGKTKATTRAFPSGCWADFGYFCRGARQLAQPHLLPPGLKRVLLSSEILVILGPHPCATGQTIESRQYINATKRCYDVGGGPALCPSHPATTSNQNPSMQNPPAFV
jgi:hypothetical protein